jgi:DNA (cytosine-5)-methyltransferase 1
VGRGLAVVISDLAEMGYVQKWLDLGATAVGMDSNRERLWLLAYPLRSERRQESHNGPNRRMGGQRKYVQRDGDWQGALREFRGVDDGLAYGVERTDAIRNGQIPSVAATAWSILNGT